MEKQTNTESWDNFCGSNFLKAEHVKSAEDPYIVVSVGIFTDDNGNSKPRLTLERDNTKSDFDLNVTNSNFCKEHGVDSPKDLIGKKLYFKKIYVTSPKTKKEVESLRITKIE